MQLSHALYRETGDWYHVLKSFPAALFDKSGYVMFRNSEEYSNFIEEGRRSGVKQNVSTNTLSVPHGISTWKHYNNFS